MNNPTKVLQEAIVSAGAIENLIHAYDDCQESALVVVDQLIEQLTQLKEQMENSEPIGRIIEDRTHHLVEIHGYCKAMYGLPIKGRTNLYTHPAPQGETDAKSTEPVAWRDVDCGSEGTCHHVYNETGQGEPLYLHPPLKGATNDDLRFSGD